MAALLFVVGVVLTALLARDALAQEGGLATADERAPFALVGTLTDASGQPLVGAFVSLADSEWGSLTNEAGRFRLPNVTPGEVSLSAELIGYETLVWSGRVSHDAPLTLTLESKPILLEGLNVVTDRFETRRRGTATSVRWFDRSALATSPQDNALDFLATRGLTRTPCRGVWSSECFIVRGRATEPVVWVDEAPVIGGMDYLRGIPPHELYMVEVYASGRHIRAYTSHFMERAAKIRIRPAALLF
jgi:hypothetical protein